MGCLYCKLLLTLKLVDTEKPTGPINCPLIRGNDHAFPQQLVCPYQTQIQRPPGQTG